MTWGKLFISFASLRMEVKKHTRKNTKHTRQRWKWKPASFVETTTTPSSWCGLNTDLIWAFIIAYQLPQLVTHVSMQMHAFGRATVVRAVMLNIWHVNWQRALQQKYTAFPTLTDFRLLMQHAYQTASCLRDQECSKSNGLKTSTDHSRIQCWHSYTRRGSAWLGNHKKRSIPINTSEGILKTCRWVVPGLGCPERPTRKLT